MRSPGRIITRPRYREPTVYRTSVRHAGAIGTGPANIWNTTNIGANLGTTIDNGGATINSAFPSQTILGWQGAPAGGNTHRLVMSTGNVTGNYRIVGAVNSGNVLVPSAAMGPNQSIVIDIPTAAGETGWELFSETLTVGRLNCKLYEVG